MFFSKKPKPKAKGKPDSGKLSSEEIRVQAMETARKARAEIGDENLQRIAAALQKREQSVMERAKVQIKSLDQERVADNLRLMLDER